MTCPPFDLTIIHVMTTMIDQLTTEQEQEIKQFIQDNFTQEQVLFSQAVSICSIITELGLLRATLEDIVDGLHQRFCDFVDKESLTDTAVDAVRFGLIGGLFEYIDQETISLTEMGMFLGSDWLKKLKEQ